MSSGLDLARTSNLSLILSKASPLAMVSTLSSTYLYYAYLVVLAQSQRAVLHFLQTTPPTILLNYVPSMTKASSFSFRIPTSLAIALAVTMLSPVTILTMIPALWHC